jgi:hypothetical protein
MAWISKIPLQKGKYFMNVCPRKPRHASGGKRDREFKHQYERKGL